jgi:DNA modification methylase
MKINLLNGDVYACIKSLEDHLIDVVVTSPPYWGQRDYGFAGQIGNENNYQEYIEKLVVIFSILRQKLSDKGVFFLNVGDKYISKYGKTPLGFIPFQLAFFMQKDGWYLNDTIIWFKPNHMPSSIKNRFTNSYEPIFVFSKSKENFYNQQIEKTRNHSNILKVLVQPTPYKHVAVYPEKLVLELIKKVTLPKNATILDPFAGSGTTLKVVKEHFPNSNAIMIEKNEEYIKIIKERCNLNGVIEIQKFDFIPFYSKELIKNNIENKLFEQQEIYETNKGKNGFVKIFDNKTDYYLTLNLFKNQYLKLKYNKNATFFIGCKDFDNELIYDTSQLNLKGWIIRNMLVVEENNRWFPIFMIVDDNKFIDYVFNYKSLNLKSKSDYKRNWNETNFIGYRVVNNISKIKKDGKIVSILETLENGFPKYVIVEWFNNEYTKEFVIYSQDQINKNLIINFKNFQLDIKEKEIFTDLKKNIEFFKKNFILQKTNLFDLLPNKNYNGKYKNEKRINFGASPGARASVDQEYFSLQRLYEVDQNLIVDYLNKKRKEKGYSKTELTKCFPLEYKHTVGHWLRKDFGGSLPTPEDWEKLTKILDIDENITNYVCKTALKIQTVKHADFKMPDDFQNIEFIEKLELLLIDT